MTKVGDRTLDWRTLVVLAVLVAGMPLLVWAHHAAQISFWVAGILGVLLMNLSFTVWHETSHANLVKSAAINHGVGVLASFFSVYPGYFARRREHLAHHKWEGHPDLDPVYSRVQSSARAFLWRLTWLTIQGKSRIEPNFMPFAEWQRRIDRLMVGAFAFLVGVSLHFGFFSSVLAVFVLPRLVIFYLHAYYICYLPHAKLEGGFEKYRVAKVRSIWWRFLTAGQWAHGVHHRWPQLRWYQYSEQVENLSREEARR